MLIVAVPSDKQVAAAVKIVGTCGVINWISIVNGAESKEVQNPLELVTVYAVPVVMLLITPVVISTVGPLGEKTYVCPDT